MIINRLFKLNWTVHFLKLNPDFKMQHSTEKTFWIHTPFIIIKNIRKYTAGQRPVDRGLERTQTKLTYCSSQTCSNAGWVIQYVCWAYVLLCNCSLINSILHGVLVDLSRQGICHHFSTRDSLSFWLNSPVSQRWLMVSGVEAFSSFDSTRSAH